ncbi:MAG: hypothetical protein R2698_11810 [Microthrixaceae bacterium]
MSVPTSSAPRSIATSTLGYGLVIGTCVTAFVLGRPLWFFSDDWNIYSDFHRSRDLLRPFNSHLSTVPVALYQVLFHTVGVEVYWPYRLVGVAAYGLLGWAVFRFARDRLAGVPAVLVTAAVLWNSAGVTNAMFPFLMNFSIPVAALAIIWRHLERARRTSGSGVAGHELVASVWLVVALATSGLGLLVAVAVAVHLVWTRPPVRTWLAMAPGPLLWLVWYSLRGVDSPPSGGLRPVASYAVRMIWGGFTSLAFGQRWFGLVLAVAYLVLVVLAAVWWRSFDAVAGGSLAACGAFAVLTAVSRIGVVPHIPPDELRYRWTVAAFLVLAAVPMMPGWPRRRGDVWSRAFVGLGAVLVVVNGVLLVRDVDRWVTMVEQSKPGLAANLWVVERAAADRTLDATTRLPLSYVPVTAGDYIGAVGAVGSPIAGWPLDALGGTAASRRQADEALVRQYRVRLVPPDQTCRVGRDRLVTAGPQAVGVTVGLFGSASNLAPVGTVPAGTTRVLRLRSITEAASMHWKVSARGARVVACSATAARRGGR